MELYRLGLSATALLLLAIASGSQAQPANADLVKASLLADVDAVVAGDTFTLGVRLKIAPGWHVYWVNPGEAGDATRVAVTAPKGFEAGPVQYPIPTKIEVDGGVAYGYEREVLLLIPVKVAGDLAADGQATIRADVSWLSCKETCIEGSAKLTITLPIRRQSTPANQELFASWRERLPIARDQQAALSGVTQPSGADRTPLSELIAEWKEAPAKVDWFPISTRAVAIENVVVKHDGRQTRVRFKPTVYKPEQVPGGRVDGVLVFEDAKGRRHGVMAPVIVTSAK